MIIVEFTKVHETGVLAGLESPGQRVRFCSLATAHAFAARVEAMGSRVTFIGEAA